MCIEKTPDDGQRNCPKHVEFYSKNKFKKLVRLVGFITRIYRGVFRQIRLLVDSGMDFLHVAALGATTRLNSALYLTYCTLHRVKDMMNYIPERPVCTVLAPLRSVYFLCLFCFFVAHCVKQQPSHYCAADRSHQYSRSGSATTMAAGHCPSVSI